MPRVVFPLVVLVLAAVIFAFRHPYARRLAASNPFPFAEGKPESYWVRFTVIGCAAMAFFAVVVGAAMVASS